MSYSRGFTNPYHTDVEVDVCPKCGGDKKLYYHIDGERITAKEYKSAPKGEADWDVCDRCDGVGEVAYAPLDTLNISR